MANSRAATEWVGFKTIIIREFSRIVRIGCTGKWMASQLGILGEYVGIGRHGGDV